MKDILAVAMLTAPFRRACLGDETVDAICTGGPIVTMARDNGRIETLAV